MGDSEILLLEMNTDHSSQLISGKLAAVRGKQLRLSLGAGLAWTALAVVALLGAVSLAKAAAPRPKPPWRRKVRRLKAPDEGRGFAIRSG